MDRDEDDDSHSVINPTCRPSYMDNGDPSPSLFDFNNRVMKKLSNEFAMTEDTDKIKTYLRIRPASSRSKESKITDKVFSVDDDYTLVVRPPPKKNFTTDTSASTYTYSRVFGQETQQSVVFDKCVQSVLNGFLCGGNGLIFSYGATNSGKTFTMQGRGKDLGIVPRTLHQLFSRLGESLYKGGDIKPQQFDSYVILDENSQKVSADTKFRVLKEARAKIKPCDMTTFMESMVRSTSSSSSVCSSSANHPPGSLVFPSISTTINECFPELPDTSTLYAVWVSFAEIYNERVYDLFDTPKENRRRRELKIFQDKQSRVYIKDLTECNANNAEEAYQFFLAGKQNLQFAATNINANSSRSHSFFNIRIVAIGKAGNHLYPKEVRRFSFSDLAGLERMSQTGNYGLRLKESGNINQSLLVLLRCIRALRDQQQKGGKVEVIPYRDSKLTRLFQSYLTTATQISMIVNINPDPEMIEASIQVIQNSAIASTIRTFKKIEAPSNNTSFCHKVRKSIRIAHAEEGGEDENESDEETPVVSTVRKVKPALAPGEKIVNTQAEKLMFERRINAREDQLREEIHGKYEKLLESQKQHYEKLLKSEREYGEVKALQCVDHTAGMLNEYVKECIQETASDSTEEEDESPSPDMRTVRRHTLATPAQRPVLSKRSVYSPSFQLEQRYNAALERIEDLENEKENLVETVRSLSDLRLDKCNQIQALSVDNENLMEQKIMLENLVRECQNFIKSKDQQILSLQQNNPSLQNHELMNQVAYMSSQLNEKNLELADVRKELQEGLAMCLNYDTQLRVANDECESLTNEVNRLHQQNLDLKADRALLQMNFDQQ